MGESHALQRHNSLLNKFGNFETWSNLKVKALHMILQIASRLFLALIQTKSKKTILLQLQTLEPTLFTYVFPLEKNTRLRNLRNIVPVGIPLRNIFIREKIGEGGNLKLKRCCHFVRKVIVFFLLLKKHATRICCLSFF